MAELGGFSKAATELFISQSAVSQSIKQLEDSLGVKLFNRQPRGVMLTDAGEALMKQVRPAISGIETGERSIRNIADLKAGTVTISASDTFCMYLFPAYIAKFNRTYPDVRLNIANMTSSETRELLLDYKADIGIINLHKNNSDRLRIWKEYVINDCFIIKKGSLDSDKPMKPSDIASFNHIMLENGTSTRAHIEKYFTDAGSIVSPGIELGSVELLIRFASMGMGVSCVAREFLENSAYRDRVDIIPTTVPVQQRSIGVVTLEGNTLSRATEAFLEIILEA